ncbi:MAG: phosphatidate cytidylyltransferase [Pseudomonadota bacterium]
MLKQRVITALVLLAVFLPALFAPVAWPFGVVSLVLIGVAGWEWGRLNGAGPTAALAWGGALVGVCAVGLWFNAPAQVPAAVWWVTGAFWVLGGAVALKAGVTGWPHLWRPARLVLGWVLLGLSWLAMTTAREQGVVFLLSLLVLVWMADVAAYFGGRALGRRKLALSISPGKSWEGVYAGLVAVVVLAVVWAWLEQTAGSPASFMSLIQRHFGWSVLVLTALYIAALSVLGDLLESLVKRSAGVKDSSRLLPGHGGVLDRIDALLPVFPAALALASL